MDASEDCTRKRGYRHHVATSIPFQELQNKRVPDQREKEFMQLLSDFMQQPANVHVADAGHHLQVLVRTYL